MVSPTTTSSVALFLWTSEVRSPLHYSDIVTNVFPGVGFKLKVHFNSSGEQLSPSKSAAFEPLVSYTPTTLEQETDQDLLDSLDFLTESFDFQPSQMDTFLRTLVDRVKGV
jgi:hypothetical protein